MVKHIYFYVIGSAVVMENYCTCSCCTSWHGLTWHSGFKMNGLVYEHFSNLFACIIFKVHMMNRLSSNFLMSRQIDLWTRNPVSIHDI